MRAVLALRADRYGDLTAHRALAAAVERDHVLVGPLGPEQLLGVVNGPAQRSGLRVEPGLAELVVADAAAEPGALPLVSHALRETWRRRRGPLLTVAAYREAGGVRGAIASTADELVGGLDADGQRLIRSLFVELAELTDSGEPARRRLPRAEIAELLGTDASVAEGVLGPAVDARLVVSDGEYVQIAHEALLREWPRLRGWLEEDRERIRFRRTVAEQAAEWDAGGRRPADLLGGGRLALARDDIAAGADGWGTLARTYIEASLVAHEAAREAERAQLVAQRRANRRLRTALAGVGLLLVAAVVAGIVAVDERGIAVDEAARARTEQGRARRPPRPTRRPSALASARTRMPADSPGNPPPSPPTRNSSCSPRSRPFAVTPSGGPGAPPRGAGPQPGPRALRPDRDHGRRGGVHAVAGRARRRSRRSARRGRVTDLGRLGRRIPATSRTARGELVRVGLIRTTAGYVVTGGSTSRSAGPAAPRPGRSNWPDP